MLSLTKSMGRDRQRKTCRIESEAFNRKYLKCYAPRKCLDVSRIRLNGGRSKPGLRAKAFIFRISC